MRWVAECIARYWSWSLIPLFGLIAAPAGTAPMAGHVYTTWEGTELDKCASVWLIKRFVDKQAVFRTLPRGKAVTSGIPFDTPDSRYRRDRGTSTFAAIVSRHKIADPALERLSKIVWDVEINVWDKKVTAESKGVNTIVRGMRRISKNDVDCYTRCLPVFDAIYAEFRAEKGR